MKAKVYALLSLLDSFSDKGTVRRKMTNIMLSNNRGKKPQQQESGMMTEGKMFFFKLCHKGEAMKVFNDTDLMECLLCVTFLYHFLSPQHIFNRGRFNAESGNIKESSRSFPPN